MEKKKNTRFRKTDLLIIILCLAGTISSGVMFWLEHERTLFKLNEEPVGTIVFRKRTAQRRFIDRLAWDRLRQASPVYNGDLIRTIEQSEAIITFRDAETHLTLAERTLIQIFYDELLGARIDLVGGNLDVLSASGRVVISTGDSTIIVEGLARASRNEEGLSLSVINGQAIIDGRELPQGSIFAVNNNGEINTNPMIAMTSFGSSARFLGMPGAVGTTAPTPVVFSWIYSNFNSDTYVIIEVALDQGFNRIVETRDISGAASVSIPLRNGNYWWRAYPAHGGSRQPIDTFYPFGTMEIIPITEVSLLSPAPGTEFIFPGSSRIPFSWSTVEGALAYQIEISSNANLSNPVISRQVEANSIVQTGLETGQWHWRITPVFPAWIAGSASPSAISSFLINRGNPDLAEPVLTFPDQNGTMYIDSSSHRLLWAHDPQPVSWLVELSDNSGMNNPIVRQETTFNFYSLPPDLLQDGRTWYWRISALGGANPAISTARNFMVTAGSPPSSRPVLAAVPPSEAVPPPVQTAPSEPEPVDPQPIPVSVLPEAPAPASIIVVPPVETVPPSIVVPVTPEMVTPEPAPPEPQPTVFIPETPPPTDDTFRNLTQVSGTGTVSGAFPPDHHVLTTGQLENVSSMFFVWEGRAAEYRFALYNANGEQIIPPSAVSSSSYTLTNPSVLAEGEYVWQVFERDRQGNWGLPSTASRLTIIEGPMIIRPLPAQEPGALYGNR